MCDRSVPYRPGIGLRVICSASSSGGGVCATYPTTPVGRGPQRGLESSRRTGKEAEDASTRDREVAVKYLKHLFVWGLYKGLVYIVRVATCVSVSRSSGVSGHTTTPHVVTTPLGVVGCVSPDGLVRRGRASVPSKSLDPAREARRLPSSDSRVTLRRGVVRRTRRLCRGGSSVSFRVPVWTLRPHSSIDPRTCGGGTGFFSRDVGQTNCPFPWVWVVCRSGPRRHPECVVRVLWCPLSSTHFSVAESRES